MKREPPLFLASAVVIVISIGVYVYSARAQSQREQRVRTLLSLQGADRIASDVLDRIYELFKTCPNLPNGFVDRFKQELRPTDLIDRVVPVYARYFTSSELDDMIAFYQTPTGLKLAEVEPQIAKECMRIGESWGRDAAERAMNSLGPKQVVIPWSRLGKSSLQR